MQIWALSGFLGLPCDWSFLEWNDLIAVNYQDFFLNNLVDWGKQFNHWIDKQTQGLNVIMGYSLGGRLALHALVDRPQLWHAAIIISAHPGLTSIHERQKRWQQDCGWAKRFEEETWENLIEDWNAQEIFKSDSFCFERKEANYHRRQLIEVLTQASLGGQADLRTQIAMLPMPILWITGSHDLRYCQLAQTLTFAHPHSYWKQIKQAGHRAPWSQPQIFIEMIENFLNKCFV